MSRPLSGVEYAVGVERSEHALETRLERAHANERNDPRDQPRRIRGNLIDVRQGVRKFRRRFADHCDWNVAESGFLRQHREDCLHHARREAVAYHDAVDVT